MTATLTLRGRLPGVDVDATLPAAEQAVRLDVAGFVGFAERGPLDTPVAIEDPAQYAAVFGGDVALAQDAGAPVPAQLPTCVRSFFDNGGRRCYVVRVAGPQASSGRWRVPGLEVRFAGTTATFPVAVSAAWPGSWSTGTSVQTVLLSQQLTPGGPYSRQEGGAYGRLPLDPRAQVGLQSGDLLLLDLGPLGPGLFCRVRSVDPEAGPLVDLELPVAADGSPSPVAVASLPLVLPVRSARLLRFDLVVRRHHPPGAPELERWGDLAFAPATVLPAARPCWTDVLQAGVAPDLRRSLLVRQDDLTLEQVAEGGLAVPFGMALPTGTADVADGLGDDPSGADGVLTDGDDDLDQLSLDVFTDPRLRDDSVFSLLADADQLTSLAHESAQLRGIHALVGIDEVAIVAVPDAIQRGWFPPPPPLPEPLPVPTPVEPEPVDWSGFRGCEVPDPVEPPVPEPAPAPTIEDGLPELEPIAFYDEQALLDVQVALVTMCAARADQVALLCVPRHYDVAATVAWRDSLAGDQRVLDSASTATPPLGYAGLWHPWVSVAIGTTDGVAVQRDVPPDGVAAGCIATRELARGAWIAPAGIPLRGVLRTVPAVTRAEQVTLFDAHANLVVHPPGTFTLLSAHTLTDQPPLLQVSVRRLLILIRKIALRLGQRYAFEVDNDRFRQQVRMRFDRILGALVERGGLAAYRVVVDDALASAAATPGEVVVQLQVAPTTPVEFITVTLRRTDEGLLDVVEG